MALHFNRKSVDRRAFDRFEHISPIVLHCNSPGNGAVEKKETHDYARMGNYSQNGIYFESDTPLEKGDWIFFKLSDFLDEKYEPHILRGYGAKIKWCKELSASETFTYGLGAEYAKPFTISKKEFDSIANP